MVANLANLLIFNTNSLYLATYKTGTKANYLLIAC